MLREQDDLPARAASRTRLRTTVCAWLCASKSRWLSLIAALAVLVAGTIAIAYVWQLPHEQPPLHGELVFSKLRLRFVKDTYTLDPELPILSLLAGERPICSLGANSEIMFRPPDPPRPGCDSVTLFAAGKPKDTLVWSPHLWDARNGNCSVVLSCQNEPGGASTEYPVAAGGGLHIELPDGGVLLSDSFLIAGLRGTLSEAAGSPFPGFVETLSGLGSNELRGQELTLEGEISASRLRYLRGAQSALTITLAGGQFTGGKLGQSDLGERQRHLVRTTFFRTFGAVFGCLLAVLGFLVARDWDPCAGCRADGEPRPSAQASEES